MTFTWVTLRYLWRRTLGLACVIVAFDTGQVIFLALFGRDPLVLYERMEPDMIYFMFWVIAYLGYLTCLLVVWRPLPAKMALYVRVRSRSRVDLARGRVALGAMVAVLYALCWVGTSVLVGWVRNPSASSLGAWGVAGLALLLNLYIHGLIWLLIEGFTRGEWGTLAFLTLVYAGLRSSVVYVPMHYAFLSVIWGNLIWVVAAELLGIAVLIAAVLWRDGARDVLM